MTQVATAIADIVLGDRGQARIVLDQARRLAITVTEGIGTGADVVIRLVIPARSTDAKALAALVNHIQLGQQVNTIGNIGAGSSEVIVTVVAVRCPQRALVRIFGAHTVVVLDGVIKTHLPVRVAGIQFEGMGCRHGRCQDGQGQQTVTRGGVAITFIVMHDIIAAFLYFFFARLPKGRSA
ncbi:hypothetical protein D3C87_1435560 [compost metagenome]